MIGLSTRTIQPMSPDRGRKPKPKQARSTPSTLHFRPSSDDPHKIVYFRRHKDDDPDESIPGRDFLESCPTSVRATIRAVLVAVATSPPKRFSGGGYWEAMKGDMTGWFEVRVNGPQRHHYRLFCRLDYDTAGGKPLLVVIAGLDKPFRTELGAADYVAVRALGEEYLARQPRSVG